MPLILFDKINLAEDYVFKDWQRALQKKHPLSQSNNADDEDVQISNYAVILWGSNIFLPLE